MEWALDLHVSRINCPAGKRLETYSAGEQWDVLTDNIRFAARTLGENGIQLVVEPLNHYDNPGFFLNTTDQVLALIQRAGVAGVQLQYDVYHAEREQENHLELVRKHGASIGHIQIADCPGRHQPGTGTVDFATLFAEWERFGYSGYVSMEYLPQPDTATSLQWVEAYGLPK